MTEELTEELRAASRPLRGRERDLMGGALGSFEELAPCCAADGGGSTPTCCAAQAASSGPRRAAALSDDAQEMRKLQQEAQAALHPSEARVSALFDLYDADGNGSLDPEEVKNVMLDVYKSAIAALTERRYALDRIDILLILAQAPTLDFDEGIRLAEAKFELPGELAVTAHGRMSEPWEGALPERLFEPERVADVVRDWLAVYGASGPA